MDLNNISAGGQQKSTDFKAHAQQDNRLGDAMGDLQGLSLSDSLISCMQLAIDNPDVGVIISTAGSRWNTIEGGGRDHVTRAKSRELIKENHAMGKWAFKDDNTLAGVRPLQGIYNIDKIVDARKMTRPLAPVSSAN